MADIHFDYKLALAAVEAGVDKIRINPGNIGSEERVQKVVEACGNAGVAMRIGVNGGSLDKRLLEKYGAPTAEALAESAMDNVAMLEKFGFTECGFAANSGYKLGEWHGVLTMEKQLNEFSSLPKPVIPFPELGLSSF